MKNLFNTNVLLQNNDFTKSILYTSGPLKCAQGHMLVSFIFIKTIILGVCVMGAVTPAYLCISIPLNNRNCVKRMYIKKPGLIGNTLFGTVTKFKLSFVTTIKIILQ